MATQSDTRDWRKYAAGAVKLLVGALLFFLIPIAVWRNAFGLASNLSVLPGIQPDGGAGSGAATLLYIGLLGTLIFGIVTVGTGTTSSLIGDDIDDGPAAPNTPMPTETQNQTSTPTPAPSTTPSVTPTQSQATRQAELDEFEREFRTNISTSGVNETRPHLLATEYRETPNGELELWFIFDEIEWTSDQGAQNMRTQWWNTAIVYANTVGPHDGASPDRLVVIGLNEKYNNTYFYIPTTEAQATWDREMNVSTYEANWWNRIHGYPDDHGWVQTAYDMVEAEGNTPTDSLAD